MSEPKRAILKGCSGAPTDTALLDSTGFGLVIGQTVLLVTGCNADGDAEVLGLDDEPDDPTWHVRFSDLEILP